MWIKKILLNYFIWASIDLWNIKRCSSWDAVTQFQQEAEINEIAGQLPSGVRAMAGDEIQLWTVNWKQLTLGKWACSLHTMGASSWAEWLWLVNAKHHWAFFHVTCRQLHTNVTGRLQNSTRVLTAIWSPLWAVVTEAEAVFSQCLYRTKPYNAEPILKYLQALICPINLKHYIN